MKSTGGIIILVAAFIFIGAVLSFVHVGTTQYEYTTNAEIRPTDPVRIEEAKEHLLSTFRMGIVLGVGSVLVLMVGIGVVGAARLNSSRTAVRGHSSERS
jgi:hypothetical protein